VRYFVLGENRWRSASDWPLPQTAWKPLYLHSQGDARSRNGDGSVSFDAPAKEPHDDFDYDPLSPVPVAGGPLIASAGDGTPGAVAGPIDQTAIEIRSDVLCYSSEVLTEGIEVTGPIYLKLFASTSGKDTDFTAKLVDVYPDGRSYNCAQGVLRVSGRSLAAERDPVTPGEVYELEIFLGHTSQLFRPGHRLRLNVTSSDFPNYDRNMNTGNPIGTDAKGVVAHQRVFHDAERPSHLRLPVIPAAQ
jgi:putative CocE/NonD family hydrolase